MAAGHRYELRLGPSGRQEAGQKKGAQSDDTHCVLRFLKRFCEPAYFARSDRVESLRRPLGGTPWRYDDAMISLPQRDEAAPYYFRYIERISSPDIVRELEVQSEETLVLWGRITQEQSLCRYASNKWSLRQVLNHINDSERVFLFRALWFARGFDSPLPSYDEKPCAEAARADEVAWARHVEEFRGVRLATLAFFRNLPTAAWSRIGEASGNRFTVRALAYIAAGHLEHHAEIVRERYLREPPLRARALS